MVILIQTIGQRSNQIWQHIAYESYCIENKIKFINLELPMLQKFYPNLQKRQKTKEILYPLSVFIIKVLAKLKIVKVFNLDNENDLHSFYNLKNKALLFVKGWTFSNQNILNKYKNRYNNAFLFDVSSLMQSIVGECNIKNPIIGVHIRRGDYKDFENGKYYYSDVEYISLIKNTISLIKGKPTILIFTNDGCINKKLYQETFNDIVFSQNSIEIDHSLMAMCTYLLGPPSTFTMLASYLGNTPLYLAQTTNTNFNLNDFKIYDHL